MCQIVDIEPYGVVLYAKSKDTESRSSDKSSSIIVNGFLVVVHKTMAVIDYLYNTAVA